MGTELPGECHVRGQAFLPLLQAPLSSSAVWVPDQSAGPEEEGPAFMAITLVAGGWRCTHGVVCIRGCPQSDHRRALRARAETPGGYFSVYILMLVTVSNLDLIQYINGTNRSVEHLADILSEKTGSSSWVVVFKALITVHHLMVHGNERFIQHRASRNSLFILYNFLDKSVIEGYTMSTFIRRYSRYLNEKSLSYRLIACDITKTKRGTDGVKRAMNTKELLNSFPVIQTRFVALLNFNANPDEITNGAFMLLFKDSLRLFAAYNEGILNLLGKYFDMRKNQCKESLDIYIRFLGRTTKFAQFLKVAEGHRPHFLVWSLLPDFDTGQGSQSLLLQVAVWCVCPCLGLFFPPSPAVRVECGSRKLAHQRLLCLPFDALLFFTRAVQTYVSGPRPSSEFQGHKLGHLPDGSTVLGTSFALA
ncbi:uncharacterized protein [Kogia breviceps]|uniref:uncharacterized protein n=1 Tax=Kogia breviceps TaxID=27615 RepID=UPI0027959C7B|nr:uncharacterized protein LOC131748828 [Kogia breviceps]